MRYYLVLMMICIGCNTTYKMMTRNGYANINIGMPVKTLESHFGKPYKIYIKKDGNEVYEYIERFNIGSEVIEQYHYYIIIENKKVVGKYMKLSTPSLFDENDLNALHAEQ